MRLSYLPAFLFSMSLLCLPACAPDAQNPSAQSKQMQEDSKAINDWFEARFEDQLARSPMTQTYLGMKTGKDRLDDASQLALDEQAALTQNWLTEMQQRFNPKRLGRQDRLSYQLFEYDAHDSAADHAYSGSDYVFQHMSGAHSDLPAFMIGFHKVETVDDAKDYIARLSSFDTYLGQYADRAEEQASKGVLLPRFVYPKMIGASRNVITGAPFDVEPGSPLFADFKAKVAELNLPQDEADALIAEAKNALLTSVGPAYERLIAMFTAQQSQTDERDGIWKLPDGPALYQAKLKHYTTTDMTAEEIHNIGLEEVTRIQGEMRAIADKVGFEGSLQDFFDHLRSDPKFIFANDDTGRGAYIAQATGYIDEMKANLDDLFLTKPKAGLVVKRVEPFREDTAFGAFYDLPALDGSRPGTYYINLKDMADLPNYQMQALAYHEGIPGHHMQIAIAQELTDLPRFRTLGGHTAYIEGWALYAEGLPRELDLYTDPYQVFGQLSMEIFRAARLVIDTGIHHKKWTRQQAVDYMLENTANSEGDVRAEIDRYIVWPGQATAYKVGMLKIQALRLRAKLRLGDKFDVREFHDVILTNGSVPLVILEQEIERWIESHG